MTKKQLEQLTLLKINCSRSQREIYAIGSGSVLLRRMLPNQTVANALITPAIRRYPQRYQGWESLAWIRIVAIIGVMPEAKIPEN